MSFIPYSSGGSADISETVEVIMENSKTIAVGEVAALTSDAGCTNGAAAAPLLGIVIGFKDSLGNPLQPTAYTPGTATSSDVQSVTTASDNETVAKKRAIVEISIFKKWSAAVSGTLGTTATSNKFGGWVDVDSANTNYARLLESTFTRTAGTASNFFSYGLDPSDSTRLIVSIASSLKINEQS